jgi:hypothetical protein
MLSYVEQGLTTTSLIALVIGIIYLTWSELLSIKQANMDEGKWKVG